MLYKVNSHKFTWNVCWSNLCVLLPLYGFKIRSFHL